MKKILVSLLLLLSIMNLVGCWRKPGNNDIEEDNSINQEELQKQKDAIQARKEKREQKEAEKEEIRAKQKEMRLQQNHEKWLKEKEEREQQETQQENQQKEDNQQDEKVTPKTKQEKVQQAISNYCTEVNGIIAEKENVDTGMDTYYEVLYDDETDTIDIFFYLVPLSVSPEEVIATLKLPEAKETVTAIFMRTLSELTRMEYYLSEQDVSVSYIHSGQYIGIRGYCAVAIDSNGEAYFVNPYFK